MLNILYVKQKKNKLDKPENKGNDVGQTRHYPPANKEWFNSIYAYNKNTSKLLPIADKVILKLVKSYFNLYSPILEKKIKSRRLRMRLRRLSTNRILVSRAELKHTSDKAIVTVYLYNRQEKYYINKINKLFARDLLSCNIKNVNRIYNIPVSRNNKKFFDNYNKQAFSNLVIKNVKEKALAIISKVLKQKKILIKTLSLKKGKKIEIDNYENQYLKTFLLKSLNMEMLLLYHLQIISFNKSKFKNIYLLPFTSLIENIYNKKIEFNLVNLKYLHLNSYIFSETIVTKIRNKKNRLLKVLKASLAKFKLPIENKLAIFDDIYNRNKIKQNLKINNLLNDPEYFKVDINNNDILQQILQKISKHNLIVNKLAQNSKDADLDAKVHTKNVTESILNSIKYKSVSGLRIEAAGRLTRRNTAARSVFKLRYKGNIRNIDSSNKGLSSVLLRGHAKSNLQYTKLKSKIRIGSFGIKGWVSSN